jgi:hypothetical protein
MIRLFLSAFCLFRQDGLAYLNVIILAMLSRSACRDGQCTRAICMASVVDDDDDEKEMMANKKTD